MELHSQSYLVILTSPSPAPRMNVAKSWPMEQKKRLLKNVLQAILMFAELESSCPFTCPSKCKTS